MQGHWGAVYLDNAKPDGILPRPFATHLGWHPGHDGDYHSKSDSNAASHTARQKLAAVVYFRERSLAFKAITDGGVVEHGGSRVA
jgi:hypothetical protein